MRHEIDPTLFTWMDEQRLKQGQPTLTRLLEKLGIGLADEKAALYAWAWRRDGEPRHVITVWAEEVQIDEKGNWETAISLLPSGTLTYNADQIQREAGRIAILKELVQSGHNCKAILMVNRRSKEDEARGKAAAAEFRVLDDELWHVEISEGLQQGKLRRGVRALTGRPSELDQNSPAAKDEQAPDISLRFPDQEKKERVEKAAVAYAMQVYSSEGFVKSVETENLGYDLSICDASSEIIKLKVEVKGTSGDEEIFYLTRNEYREAYRDPRRWRLAIVVNAIDSPSLQEYRVEEMENKFAMSPLAWHCSPTRR